MEAAAERALTVARTQQAAERAQAAITAAIAAEAEARDLQVTSFGLVQPSHALLHLPVILTPDADPDPGSGPAR